MSVRLRLASGAEMTFSDTPVGEGGEKVCFLSEDRQSAILFYKTKLAKNRGDRRNRLHLILDRYNPTKNNPQSEFWKRNLLWPIDMLDGNAGLSSAFLQANGLMEPALAVVTPAYPSHYFFTDKLTRKHQEKQPKWFFDRRLREKRVPDTEKGSFQSYLVICARLARAMRKMHQSGLAHSDLSYKNVLIDPARADCLVIDLDSLVVPNVAKPVVNGTPGYIAPEVLAAQGKGAAFEPCIETDRHAMAVLLYQVLLGRHPLDGKKVHHADPDLDDTLKFGAKALFVEHPSDRSNRLEPPPLLSLARLGPHLEKLFLRTFVDGLHDRNKRTLAQDWEKAFYLTLDLLHYCAACKEWFVVNTSAERNSCMFCNSPLRHQVPCASIFDLDAQCNLHASRNKLVVYDGLMLFKWHTHANYYPDETVEHPRLPRAKFFYDRTARQWKLQNLGRDPFILLQGASAPGQRIDPTQSATVTGGLRVQMAPGPDAAQNRPRVIEMSFLGKP